MVYRWALGVALLAVGAVPVLLALWGLGAAPEQDRSVLGLLVVAGLGVPALLGGGYLVARSLAAEGRAPVR